MFTLLSIFHLMYRGSGFFFFKLVNYTEEAKFVLSMRGLNDIQTLEGIEWKTNIFSCKSSLLQCLPHNEDDLNIPNQSRFSPLTHVFKSDWYQTQTTSRSRNF